jgi:hypothetical protein
VWRIGDPARKHGIEDADMLHAARNAIYRVRQEDADDEVVMLIGPARDGSPLEIGVLGHFTDDPVIIHAMPLRPKFYLFLGERRRP